MSKFGVGFSELSDSHFAGKQAAEIAMETGSINRCDIKVCFLFCTSRHDPIAFVNGVQSVLKNCPMFGGFANGTISNNNWGYDGCQTIVGILESESIFVDLFIQEGIAFNEY